MPRGFRPSQLLSLGCVTMAVALVAGVIWQHRQQEASLPREYRALQQAIDRLAEHNDLGQQPLSFSISAGSTAANLAEERGLCKQDRCDFFAQLNPYRQYDHNWDELIRQAYTIGDIEAWSASSGTVNISRASLRTYGNHQGWLTCTIAHEISHILRNHIFKHSYYVNNTLKGKGEKQRSELSFARGREQELEADSDSARMLANSGFPHRVCLENLIFLHHSSGDGSATEPDSTHPGYDDRIKAMKRVYARLETQGHAVRGKPRILSSRSTPGGFRFDSQSNLLIFQPHQR